MENNYIGVIKYKYRGKVKTLKTKLVDYDNLSEEINILIKDNSIDIETIIKSYVYKLKDDRLYDYCNITIKKEYYYTLTYKSNTITIL